MNHLPTSDSAEKRVASRDVGQTSRSSSGSQSAQPSVLQQVAQRTQARRRRRGRPPGWTLWMARQAGNSRTFFSHTVPAWIMGHRDELVSYGTSLLIIGLACLLMALWALPPGAADNFFGMIVTATETNPEPLDVVELEQVVQPEKIQDLNVNSSMQQLLADINDGDTSLEMVDIQDREFTLELEPTDLEMEAIFKQGEFGGRSKAGRRAAVKRFGGTAESEKAVALGLQWLQKIQREDGSWSFAEQGPGARAGSFQRTEVGATSLALLCFLGAGHTHAQEGPYQKTVESGLRYIGASAQITQGAADLRGNSEGNAGMYVQGLATICISEAHAMDPRNSDLKKLTDMAVSFIERSQDPSGGGWRYRPRDSPGDTSVVGWQVMALQSARAGGIRTSSDTMRDVRSFLKSVQADEEGGLYGYMPGDRVSERPSMTAVALLCRMYMGWKPDHAGLQKGVHRLSAIGPSKNDIYYNYYAAQVLHHWGGDLWEKWNNQLREQLVKTQITTGPAAGSWPPVDPHGGGGGQLYQTTLSLLTLEIYYRHLPIYRKLQKDESEPTQVSSK